MIFVDEHARVYANWNEYINNNTLPKAIIVAPKRGIYTAGIMGHVLLDIYPTPECSPGVKVMKVADIGINYIIKTPYPVITIILLNLYIQVQP